MGFVFNPFTGNLDNTGPSTTPAGSDTNVQYNDGGVFGGDANNTWNKTTKLATYSQSALASTTAVSHRLANTTAAVTGSRIQVSPATQWRGNGWRTVSGGSSRTVDFNAYTVPSTGSGEVIGEWRLDYSLNGATPARGLQYFTSTQDGVSTPRLDVNGFNKLIANNSSTIDTLSNLEINNPSGSRINQTYTFGSTIKYGVQVQDSGATYYKAAGSGATHYFQIGSGIESVSDIIQIYGGGIYNYGGMFATGKVTAGQADTSPRSYLNTYGGFAAKNKIIEDVSYTIDDTSYLWFLNPINSLCSGTATACSTYTASGEATCNSHSGVGCSWTAAVTEACSTASGTDSGTCTSLNAACIWESASCSTANNSDQATCEALDDAYGGTCAWDTSTCPSQTSTASCNAIVGCSADVSGDCTTLSDGGGDGTNCATQPECSYDSGSGVCSGSFFTACSGNLCGGTYNTGSCTGTYTITPAFCGGTALCSNLVSSGTCAAEAGGCSWTSGSNITLPTATNANESNTSHIHHFVHIGDSGTATISANTGSTIMQYSNLKLYKKGDKVSVSHTIQTAICGNILTEGACNAQSPCSWQAAVVCSTYNGDESGCNAQSSAGCSYDTETSTCSGAGSAAQCTGGSYNVSSMWVPFNYERSKNYVEKTAAYTFTNEDDVVNYTSGSVALTLPLSADIVPARPIYLKNRGGGTITLNTTSSQLIDGNASGTLTLTTGQEKTLFPLAAGWIILGV